VNEPLALLLYEKLLPGSQLLQKLRDLGYRVQTVPAGGDLVSTAEREKPMVALVDLEPRPEETAAAISALAGHPATAHIPVIAFFSGRHEAAQAAGLKAGAKLVVPDHAVLTHLNQFLDQALALE
jgi:CheY-like chemotaxis protein